MSKNTKKCFFICPIGDDNSDVRKRSDKIMRHLLSPICSNKGYEVIRADKINSANKISTDIVNHLENDELAIADLTGHNPNVFYEIGYRKAKNLPIIHIAKTETTLPFDTIDDRTIFYDLTDLDVVEEFKQKLSDFIDNLADVKINLCSKTKEEYTECEEKSYILLLREIVKKCSSSQNRVVIYEANAVDENDIDILRDMGYIDTVKYLDQTVKFKLYPTGLGLKYVYDNPKS